MEKNTEGIGLKIQSVEKFSELIKYTHTHTHEQEAAQKPNRTDHEIHIGALFKKLQNTENKKRNIEADGEKRQVIYQE